MNRLLVLVVASGCLGREGTEPEPAEAVAEAVELHDVGANPGRLRFFVREPRRAAVRPGLVVALHGCSQRAADFQRLGLERLADRDGFFLLYAQSPSASGCFRWFDPVDATRDSGELGSLMNATSHVVRTVGVAPERVAVLGLSAGAAMAAVALSQAPDVFHSGALFAGVPAGCASSLSEGLRCQAGIDRTPTQWAQAVRGLAPAPRVQVWTGSNDTVVAPAMAQELVEQFTAAHGLDAVPDREERTGRVTSTEHLKDGRRVVQALTVEGLGHAVPIDPARGCGASGAFLVDAEVCAAEAAVEFFGLSDSLALEPIAGDAGSSSAGAGSMDAGPSANGGASERPDAGTMPPDAGAGCTEVSATPWVHVLASRAVVCGFWRSLVCARGSLELVGPASSPLPVSLVRTGEQAWRPGRCLP